MISTLKVTVTTATELTDNQVNLIVKAVEKKYKNRETELIQAVDPSITDGIKIKIGDAANYTKLENLHTQLKVDVTTAIKLTDKQVNLIVKAVEKKYKNREAEIIQVVDPSIISGIKIKIGSEEIDSTAYTKLENLRAQLRESV